MVHDISSCFDPLIKGSPQNLPSFVEVISRNEDNKVNIREWSLITVRGGGRDYKTGGGGVKIYHHEKGRRKCFCRRSVKF